MPTEPSEAEVVDSASVGYEGDKDLVLDARNLKGLAHPLRLRLRTELVDHGPATASQLAARLGESSGATSYHLRQLAAYGFVVDEPSLGRGRERYWRAVHRSVWYEPSTTTPQHELGAEFVRAVAHVYGERVVRFANGIAALSEALGEEWSRSWNISDWPLDLAPEEARELGRRFHELCRPFRHEPGRVVPGKRRVWVQFQVLPMPEDEPEV